MPLLGENMANFPTTAGTSRWSSASSTRRRPCTPLASPWAMVRRRFSRSSSVLPTSTLPQRWKVTSSSRVSCPMSWLPSTHSLAFKEPVS